MPAPSVFGIEFGPGDPFFGRTEIPTAGFGIFLLLVTVALGLAVTNLRRSATGKRMLAVRSNERAAAAVGLNVRNIKLMSFAIAAFVAGVGGAMMGYKFTSLTATSFEPFIGLGVFAFAYLGGITSVTGAVVAGLLAVGGIAFFVTDELIGIDPSLQLLVGGVGLILTAVLNPEGIAGAVRTTSEHITSRRRRNTPALADVDAMTA